uniref:Uncharacterized protein n=1 Tax=Mycena chlorophos TaxID=658473 RepID=A0ABQ0LXC0_MYCCL|nr:predicted protein [Mycena chlorophos]
MPEQAYNCSSPAFGALGPYPDPRIGSNPRFKVSRVGSTGAVGLPIANAPSAALPRRLRRRSPFADRAASQWSPPRGGCQRTKTSKRPPGRCSAVSAAALGGLNRPSTQYHWARLLRAPPELARVMPKLRLGADDRATVSRATSEEAVEEELLSSSESPSPSSLSSSASSTASDVTLRNSSSSPSRPSSRADIEDNASITAALRSHRSNNELTPLFPSLDYAMRFHLYADEPLFGLVERLHLPDDPEDYNTMRDYGLDVVTGCLPEMSVERTQQFHDILVRFWRPRKDMLWRSIPEAITKVVALDASQLAFETVRNVDNEIVWRISVARLELIAHVIVATQQVLENLALFGSRDLTSTFNLDLKFKMLRVFDGCTDKTLVMTNFNTLKIRLAAVSLRFARKILGSQHGRCAEILDLPSDKSCLH